MEQPVPPSSPTSQETATNSAATPPLSPLTVDKPDTISELFQRPWTDWDREADIPRMIAHLRELRAQLGNLDEPRPKASKAAKVTIAPDASGEDILNSLGLKL